MFKAGSHMSNGTMRLAKIEFKESKQLSEWG